MAQYKLRVYDTSYTLRYEITNFTRLAYVKRLNAVGMGSFVMMDDAIELAQTIQDKWPIEVWRRSPEHGVDWYVDYYGLIRDKALEGFDPSTLTLTVPSLETMLGWRIVAYPANTTDRSRFLATPVEEIMGRLVEYNLGNSATTPNGRLANGHYGFTVNDEVGWGSLGPSVDWYCAYDNLLDTLQELALVGDVDFEVRPAGVFDWTFNTHPGQLGQDRTNDIIFSIHFGNMANPRYERGFMVERTQAIVAGRGEGSERMVVIRQGANYDAPENVTEIYVDARTTDTVKGLEAKGDARLAELQREEIFDFNVLQTEGVQYGRDYFMGDLVTAHNPYTDGYETRKITEVAVVLDDDEEISIKTSVV